MHKYNDLTGDDSPVCLGDTRSLSVFGQEGTFSGSKIFRRPPNILQPSEDMLGRLAWIADHEGQAGELWCSQCDHWKLPEAFAVDRSRRHGRCYICKDCQNAERRYRYARIQADRGRTVSPRYRSTKVSVFQGTGVG